MEKRYVDRTFKWAKVLKIFVFCMSAHQRVTQLGRILIIRWIGCLIRYIPIGLFSQPLLSLPNGLMNKVSMIAGMEQHGVPLIEANLATATAECPISQQQRLTPTLKYGTNP